MNRNLIGGLFDQRGKPQVLKESAKSKRDIVPEKLIQSSFISWRDTFKRQFPILNAIFSVPNGMWTHKAIAISQVRQGLTKGIQDVICLAPSACGKFPALLIEFKTTVGKMSENQNFFYKFFADLGYRTEICRSAFEASTLVNEHLNLKIPIYPR